MMIRVKNLSKSYSPAHIRAVDGISFDVEEGQFYTLLGPSGCGKTTTLRCIAGLERPDGGSIALGDVTVVSDRVLLPTNRRDIGMVFQSYAVWPHMTVFENVAFPLRVGNAKPRASELRARVGNALDLVGLRMLENRMATQLSGGQQQRLSLARAIVREPKVLLLDEPLSNLDARLRERMRGELSLIQRRLGLTTLFVTHDQVEALSMSDRIAVMEDGKISQEGSPEEIYHQPDNAFVASFIGSTNLLRGSIESESHAPEQGFRVTTDLGSLRCEGEPPAVDDNSSVIVAVRPEEIVLLAAATGRDHFAGRPNVLEGRVQIGLFTGTSMEYYLVIGDTLVQARATSRTRYGRGDHVFVEVPAVAIHVFPTGTEAASRLLRGRETRLAQLVE